MTPRHLYLHVPFCLRRCGYCDFAVQATRRPDVAGWLDAVSRELGLLRSERGWPRLELETIYLGGGTPSLLGVGALAELRARLSEHAELEGVVEFTAEANPESFDAALAEDWLASGVNRLSLGVQSFAPAALRWMGRLHGPDGALRAFEAARAAGFDNISVDLIFGLPVRIDRSLSDDLARALALRPEHVSLYGLTAEAGAALGRWVREGRERMVDDETYAAEYLEAFAALRRAGYRAYEVSNFAAPGRESRHNRAYWTGGAYVGLGPGAHSFVPPLRWWNRRSWEAYRAGVASGVRPTEETESLDAAAAEIERLWLGLRTAEGMDAAGMTRAQRQAAEAWQARGWATVDEDRVVLSPEGWLLLDELVIELAAAADAVVSA